MTTKSEGQMPWIKFNPEEWLGYCDGMTDSAEIMRRDSTIQGALLQPEAA